MTARARFLPVVLILLVFTGCMDETKTIYDGPLQVEFKPLSNGAYRGAVPDGAGLVELTAQLIGPQQTSALNLAVAIADETTAEAGVHYRLPDGGAFTIPPNSSSGVVRIEVLNGGLAAGASRSVVVELQGNDAQEVIPAVNVATFTLDIVGVN